MNRPRWPRRRRSQVLTVIGVLALVALVGSAYAWNRGWLDAEYLASARDDLTGCGDVEWTTEPRVPDAPLGALEPVLSVAAETLTGVVPLPDDERWLLLGESGRIHLADPATGATEVVLDLTAEVSTERDRGLLGMVIDAARGVAYVLLTGPDGDSRLEARTLVEGLPTGPTELVMEVAQDDEHHNGGGLVLDGAGDLWIAFGDGGLVGDTENRAQDLSTLLGKIVRITPTPGADEPYAVPEDNPFVDRADARPEIFALGLRNPFRMSLDDRGTLWIGDVGNLCVEEINRIDPAVDAGANLGWNRYEGVRRFTGGDLEDHHEPVFTYPHADGWCATIGGSAYAGDALGALDGTIVVGDFCSGRLLAVSPDGSDAVDLGLTDAAGTVEITRDHDDELLVVGYNGTVSRLVPPPT